MPRFNALFEITLRVRCSCGLLWQEAMRLNIDLMRLSKNDYFWSPFFMVFNLLHLHTEKACVRVSREKVEGGEGEREGNWMEGEEG